ncbi:MAG: peroxiredoxin-like family protein [Bacteroidales bacterium]|nr:peroxiredoxin-like family protein [Bacteroidales bacterium]
MNKIYFILILFSMIGMPSYAQIPEKPEDISPLLNGENIPEATLLAPEGSKQVLSSLLAVKPSILLFYRGGWCPYCNAHLSEIQNVEDEILKLGYQILAISPDSPENLKQTTVKDNLNYSLYSDADGILIKAIGIAYKAPSKYADMLKKSSGGYNEGFLPVPAVFVVDTSGKILFEYINPDYSTRLSSGLLLAILKEIKIN